MSVATSTPASRRACGSSGGSRHGTTWSHYDDRRPDASGRRGHEGGALGGDHIRVEGSTGRIRHGDISRYSSRSAPGAGVRVRPRHRPRAPSLARRPALRARLPATTGRGRAAPQAHADARLRLRRHARPRAADRRAPRARSRGRLMSDNGASSTREQAIATLRRHDKFLLTTHERPDGDAVGSLAAMQQALAALGKDAVAFLTADEFPLPYEYRFIHLDGLATEPPADLAERVMVFLDCGNIDRSPVTGDGSPLIVNIDHHHDNTRFGTINHVDPHASCTAEMVWDLMHGLGVAMTPAIGEALYV